MGNNAKQTALHIKKVLATTETLPHAKHIRKVLAPEPASKTVHHIGKVVSKQL